MLRFLKTSMDSNEGVGLILRRIERQRLWRAYQEAKPYESKIFGDLCYFWYESTFHCIISFKQIYRLVFRTFEPKLRTILNSWVVDPTLTLMKDWIRGKYKPLQTRFENI